MNGTLVLSNGSYFPGNFLSNNPAMITSPVYDPATGMVYIAGTDTANLSVFDPLTGAFVANYATGSNNSSASAPTSIALDAANGYLYIANSGNDSVLVFDPVTHTAVTSISVANGTEQIAFDPVDGSLFVTGAPGSNLVSVIDPTNATVVATVPVGSGPRALAVDAQSGNVFVGNYLSHNVSIINGTTYRLNATVGLPSSLFPATACFDPSTAEVLVAGGPLGNVTLLDAHNGSVAGSIPVVTTGTNASFTAMAFDSANGLAYVTDAVTGVVRALNVSARSLAGTIPVGGGPSGIAFDPFSDLLYTTNPATRNVSVIDPTSARVLANPRVSTAPWGAAFDPSQGTLYVSNSTSYGTYSSGSVLKIRTPSEQVESFARFGLAPLPVPLGYGAFEEAYDPSNARVYVLLSAYANTSGATYDALGSLNTSTGVADVSVPLNYTATCLLYDPANHVLYVGATNASQGFLLGFSSTGALVSQLPLNATPEGMTFGGSNGDLYLTALNGTADAVLVVSPTLNRTIATVLPDPTFTATPTVVYDPYSGVIFAGNDVNGMAVLNATTGRLVTNVSGVGLSGAAVFDPANGFIYATEAGADLVAVINGTSQSLVTNLAVGVDPTAIALNATGGTLYVTNLLSGSVSTIELGLAAPNATVTSVTVSPRTATVAPNGTIAFRAQPVCAPGPCPASIGYRWSISHPIGTLNRTSGPSVLFSAGSASGIAALSVVASLPGSVANGTATVNATGTPVPALSAVSILPVPPTLRPGDSLTFSAIPDCSGAACPAGTTYAWSLSNALGRLGSATGPSVVFTAGASSGTTLLTVTAFLAGHNASSSASIVIATYSGSGSGPWYRSPAAAAGIGAVGVGLVLASAYLVRRREVRARNERSPRQDADRSDPHPDDVGTARTPEGPAPPSGDAPRE